MEGNYCVSVIFCASHDSRLIIQSVEMFTSEVNFLSFVSYHCSRIVGCYIFTSIFYMWNYTCLEKHGMLNEGEKVRVQQVWYIEIQLVCCAHSFSHIFLTACYFLSFPLVVIVLRLKVHTYLKHGYFMWWFSLLISYFTTKKDAKERFIEISVSYCCVNSLPWNCIWCKCL